MLKKIWEHFEEYILISSLMFSVALLFFQVLMRYLFDNSLSWSEELARYIFIWQLWLGISYAAKNCSHLRITLIQNILSEKGKIILESIALVIWIGFMCFIVMKSSDLMIQIASYGQKSPALRFPMEYAYAAIPVGGVLTIIRLIENLINLWRSKKGVQAE